MALLGHVNGTDRMVDVAVVGTIRRPRHFHLIPMRGVVGCAGTGEMETSKGAGSTVP